jgi:uncharacterized protein (UPF0335 family)
MEVLKLVNGSLQWVEETVEEVVAEVKELVEEVKEIFSEAPKQPTETEEVVEQPTTWKKKK